MDELTLKFVDQVGFSCLLEGFQRLGLKAEFPPNLLGDFSNQAGKRQLRDN
jgi:hypothetical protein